METEHEKTGGAPMVLGLAGCLAISAVGLVQLYAGFVGLAARFGPGWALGGLIAMVVFRSSLPMIIGAFFCARDVWGWHWAFALLFTAPGLVLVVPSVVTAVVERVVSRVRR